MKVICNHCEKEITLKDDKNRPELKGYTPLEICKFPEAFHWNEYYRLTGQWFIPLPCHFWQFKKGMEFDIDYDDRRMLSLSFHDHLTKNLFDAFVNDRESEYFFFSNIKRMRIKSFEVKNDTIIKMEKGTRADV